MDTSVSLRNLPEPFKHGIEHESRALEQYQNYLKHSGHPLLTFSSGFFLNPAYSFLGCSPDAMVIDETQDKPYGIAEINAPTDNELSHLKRHVLGMVNFIWKWKMTF